MTMIACKIVIYVVLYLGGFMKSIQKDFWWKQYFDKRYLPKEGFVRFCEVVGLYGCLDHELEEYEQRGLLYPVARFEHPENYMLINNLPDFRHPIDVALETSSLPALIKPQNHKFLTWDNYVIRQENNQVLTTTHYYHYWQVYELYRARIIANGMYLDKSLPVGNFDIAKLQQFLEIVSYFQHLYRADLSQVTNQIEFNGDNIIIFNDEQKAYIEEIGRKYAMQTLAKYTFTDSFLYEGLKNLLYLYYQYEQSERYKLAETLKADIWRSVEFMCFALSTTSEAISEQIGYAGLGISNQRTLEILFPNRRREIKAKVKNIIQNSSTQILYLPDNYIDEFLDFIEQTELNFPRNDRQ